jgi:multiple sugar transport system substrate-binding protein
MATFSRRDFLAACGTLFGSAFAARLAPLLAQQVQPATPAELAYTGDMTFWDWNFDPRADLMEELIANWQSANEGISLNYTTFGYGDLQTRVLTAGAAETTPPLSNVHAFWRLPLQKAGRLEPFPQDLFDYDDLVSTAYNRAADGNIYTSTFGYYCDIVFYNEDILAAAGYTADDIPANWDDFIAFAQELTVTDSRGVTQPGCGLNHYYSQEWLWTSMVYQLGGYLYNEDGTRAIWNSEEGVEALQMIKNWFGDFALDDPNLLRHYEQWGNQEAAMFISHGYWAPTIPTDYPDINWGTKAIPTFTGDAAPSYGLIVPEEGLAVFSNYPDEVKAAAFDFIRYVLGPQEHRLRWSLIATAPPDSLSVDLSAIADQDPGNAIASQAQTLPFRINYGERPVEAEPLWREMFERVILSDEDAQPVLDDITARMNEVMAESETGYVITERNFTPPPAST